MSVHLQSFKKCVVEGARGLADGAQWLSVVDYSIIAWGYVKVGGVYIEKKNWEYNKISFALFL